MVGERDALRTCSPPQPGDARRLRDPRSGSPAELRGAGRRRRPARVLACGPRNAARRARRGMAAEPGRDRDRVAGLFAQLLCLLPVAAPRPHGRSGRGAGRSDARRRDHRATRLRRPRWRCWGRSTRSLRRAGRPRFPALRLACRAGRRSGVRRSAGTGSRQAAKRRSEQDHLSGFHLRHHGHPEGRSAQRQHPARLRAHDGARLASRRAACSTR